MSPIPSTLNLTPPNSSPITIYGRTYNGAFGSVVFNVPYGDAVELIANGWAIAPVSSSSGTATPATPVVNYLSVPSGASALFSMIQTAGYNGPCLRVQRASDSATLDIGFANQTVNGALWSVCDWATADTWSSGSAMTVVIWYDQSGNGANATPGTTYIPAFTKQTQYNNIRPATFNALGYGASTAPLRYNLNISVSVTTNSFTLYHCINPRNFWFQSGLSSLQTVANGGTGTDQGMTYASRSSVSPLSFYNNGAGQHIGATGTNPGKFLPDSQPVTLSVSGNQAAQINMNQFTLATALSSTTCANLSIGASATSGSTAGYNFSGDFFFCALYPSNHSQAQQTSINQSLTSAFRNTLSTYLNLVYGGSSLISSYNQTNAKTLPFVAGFGRTQTEDYNGVLSLPSQPHWSLYNFGYAGQTLATEYADYTYYASSCLATSALKNVYVMDAPSNDIAAGSYTSVANAQASMLTLYTGTTLPFVAALLALGFNGVVVPTVIPRTGMVSGSGNYQEDARLYYNYLVRMGSTNSSPSLTQATWAANAVSDGGAPFIANGYRVSDRAACGQFSITSANITNAPGNLVYSADYTHPSDLGYQMLAACDLREILAF